MFLLQPEESMMLAFMVVLGLTMVRALLGLVLCAGGQIKDCFGLLGYDRLFLVFGLCCGCFLQCATATTAVTLAFFGMSW